MEKDLMTSCFIEYMTLRTWLFSAFPRLGRRRLRGELPAGTVCYVIDTTPAAWRTARLMAPLIGLRLEYLEFSLPRLRDSEGLPLQLRVAHRDLLAYQRDVLQGSKFQNLASARQINEYQRAFLAKSLVAVSPFDRGTSWRALLFIQIAVWKLRQDASRPQALLLMERRPWMDALQRYVSSLPVELEAVAPSWDSHALRRLFSPLLPGPLVLWLNRLRHGTWKREASPVMQVSRPNGPRVAAEYYGNLHLDHPERFSDLFFWQESELPAEDIVMLFAHPNDALDAKKVAELGAHGIAMSALRPEAARVKGVSAHRPPQPSFVTPSLNKEAFWMDQRLARYRMLRDHWREVFISEQAKVYVTWFKYDATPSPIAEAMADAGGITAIYQRAYDPLPSAGSAIVADISFGYSSASLEPDRRIGSQFRYHVSTGFLGDHRIALLRPQAAELRRRLQSHGVSKIIAFTDENSHDDRRWLSGHDLPREAYGFLLEKVLANTSLGLILKPKTPHTLRRRLGPVAELLQKAEATGRCYVFEEGHFHGAYPPSAAALAADLAIHGHLCAGTAGFEMALAGVPTLLMDREGHAANPLYRLGVGKVVFNDWPTLWNACTEHWKASVPGFGDWSAMLNELDPFRDGQAARRLGTYLEWLLDGFKEGLDRETVLRQAAERYTARWGKDKVVEWKTATASPKVLHADHRPEPFAVASRAGF